MKNEERPLVFIIYLLIFVVDSNLLLKKKVLDKNLRSK